MLKWMQRFKMFISPKMKISHFNEKPPAPAIPGLWSIEKRGEDEEGGVHA